MTSFSEKVNISSNVVATLTQDPAERLGLATALVEIYRYELSKNFVSIKTPDAPPAGAAPVVENAPEVAPSVG